MRILLVGHGRMGRLVGDLAPEYGCEIAGIIDPQSPLHAGGPDEDRWRGVDVAIDFTFPGAVKTNVPALARHGINIVIGTTGWLADEPAVRGAAAARFAFHPADSGICSVQLAPARATDLSWMSETSITPLLASTAARSWSVIVIT